MEQLLAQKFKCSNFSICGQAVSKRKHLQSLKDGEFCDKCVQERRREHREFLKREVLHIRKRSDLKKEWAEKRRLMESLPKVNGSKTSSRPLHFYITKNEKDFLWRKYVQMGLNPLNANERIKKDVKFLQDLVVKLREQKKEEVDINSEFKEAFSKMIMESR